MARFNYPNLAAVYDEDVSILQLLEAESYGVQLDHREELDEQQREYEMMRLENGQ